MSSNRWKGALPSVKKNQTSIFRPSFKEKDSVLLGVPNTPLTWSELIPILILEKLSLWPDASIDVVVSVTRPHPEKNTRMVKAAMIRTIDTSLERKPLLIFIFYYPNNLIVNRIENRNCVVI